MGQTPTETVREIEQTRRRLDSELEELGTYLPTAWLKRAAAIVAGAWAGIMLLGFVARKRRERRGTRRLRTIERRLGTIEGRLDRSAIAPLRSEA